MMYNSTPLLPLISNLPITQQEKLMYSQLYGMNYPIKNQKKTQIYQSQSQQYPALQYGYHSQFIPAYQNLPLIQSQQISPLPLNYNIGSMVHQPGTQIRLGFDLSDFGIPNDPVQIRKPFVKKIQPKKLYPQIPDDYLERVELPRIQLQEEEQYRIIYQKKKQNQQLQQQQQQKQKYEESDSYLTNYNPQTIFSKNKSNLPTNQASSSRNKQLTIFQDTPKASEIKSLKKKKINWRKKTKILRINLIFLALYLKSIKLIVDRKKELALSELKMNMSSALNQLLDWLDLRIDDCLHELINNTVDFQLVLGQDKVNESKKKAIQEFLTKLIGKVVKNFKFEELFKDSLLKVMSILIKSYSFPPFKYFSKFEAQRLPLTKFGSYSLMSQEHQKMVLLVFLFIRSIIFSNLFKVWQFYPNKGNQAQILLIQKNSVILSSILHDIIIKWVSKTLPIKQKDLNELKKQVDFNDYPLSDNLEEIKKSNKTFPDYMLIEGLLSQTILLKYTHNENNVRFEWIDRLEKQIMEFCDLILDQFDRYHRDTTNIKERLIQQMIKIDQENNRFKTRKRK